MFSTHVHNTQHIQSIIQYDIKTNYYSIIQDVIFNFLTSKTERKKKTQQ